MAPSRPRRRLLAVLVALGCLAPTAGRALAATNGIRWSDVPRRHWARAAVNLVGATNDWMRDYPAKADGTYPFHPNDLESRSLFARSVVRAFAPQEPADPAVSFPDLPAEDPLAPFANVAVKLGWMATDAGGNFLPNDPVTPRMAHRALVLAVGLGDLAAGLDAIHTRDGTPFQVPPDFGTLLVGMRIGLRYNHSEESLDVAPDTPLSRAEVAWSLSHAATMPTWMHDSLAGYASIVLPNLGPAMRRVVQFGIESVGSPYVWGGEWNAAAPSGYCCGFQPVGGFDCSGLTWWLMKRAEGGWSNQPPRTYAGWSLPQRSSADMASTGQIVRRLRDVRPGDLMFYDGSGDGIVDHVDVAIGGGWALDSSGSAGGVTITNVTSGWYRDNFVHARRIIGAATPTT
jgi:hypothetical protein